MGTAEGALGWKRGAEGAVSSNRESEAARLPGVKFLFVMDPHAGMLPGRDTSLAFMLAAQQREHTVFHCAPAQVANRGQRVWARSERLRLRPTHPVSQAVGAEVVAVDELDAVFVRKDPPFDPQYMHLTQQLDLVKARTLIVNEPSALRDANEKLFAFHFQEFAPPTLVSSDERELTAFVQEMGGQAVIKPLDGAGGSGVAVLGAGDLNLRPLIGLLTAEGKRLALVQEYQPSVVDGDKRVLLLDGRVLGSIRRVPVAGDIRANIHVGGRVEATELTARERQIAESVGKRLAAQGLFFVGLDLINEKLIEINVTSPTGIQELGDLTQTEPAAEVIRWVEKTVAEQPPNWPRRTLP